MARSTAKIELFSARLLHERGTAGITWRTAGAKTVSLTVGDKPPTPVPPRGAMRVEIRADTTFELTATDKSGRSSKKTLSVIAVPELARFDVAVAHDESKVTFHWDVGHAERVTLGLSTTKAHADHPLRGSHTASLDGVSRTFVLTAYNGPHSRRWEKTVEVHPVPGIDSFTQTLRADGRTVDLAWRTTHAQGVSLRAGAGRAVAVPASGARAEKLQNATKFTLTAKSGPHACSRSLTTTPCDRPKLQRFDVRLGAGGKVTVNWKVARATKVRLGPSPGRQTKREPAGTLTESMGRLARKSYVLIANNGPFEERWERTVEAAPAPEVSLSAVHTAWNSADLIWSVTGADSVSISGAGLPARTVPTAGRMGVHLARPSNSFKLVAQKAAGATTRRVEVAQEKNLQASWTSQRARAVRFENAAALALRLEWMGLDAAPQAVANLALGTHSDQASFVDHLWRLVDPVSGRVVLERRLTDADEVVRFTGAELRPGRPGKAVNVKFRNEYVFPITLFQVGPDGTERPVRKLDRGNAWSMKTRAGALFRARHPDTGAEAGVYIAGASPAQHRSFTLSDSLGIAHAGVEFVNHTPLRVAINWIDQEGEELPFGELVHHDRLYLKCAIGHRWVLRDVGSGRLLGDFVVDEQREQVAIRAETIRALPGGRNVYTAFTNDTPFELELLRVGEDGTQTSHATLAPGRSVTTRWPAHTPWVARESGRRRVVGMYINSTATRQTYSFGFASAKDPGKLPPNELRSLTFVNDSLLSLTARLVLPDGSLKDGCTLSAGETETIPDSFDGAAWILEDEASGQPVDFAVDQPGLRTLRIDDSDLQPGRSEHAVSATFTNRLPFAVDLMHLGKAGVEQLRAQLAPGAAATVTSFTSHALRARTAMGGVEVALFILGQGASQSFDIALRSPPAERNDPLTRIRFLNNSPLELDIFWVDEGGQERLFKSIGPRRTFNAVTRRANFWVVRDAASGEVITLTRSLSRPQDFTITGHGLRSTESGRARQISVKNESGRMLDLRRVTSDGGEEGIGELAAGALAAVNAKPGAVLRAVDADGSLVGLHVVAGSTAASWRIADRRSRTPPTFTAAFARGRAGFFVHGSHYAIASFHSMSFGAAAPVALIDLLPRLQLSEPDALCCPDGKRLYVFQGAMMCLYDLARKAPAAGWTAPRPIADAIRDMPFAAVDAAVASGAGEMVLFSGNRCATLSVRGLRAGEPEDLVARFPRCPFDRLDAAVRDHLGKLWFFSGAQAAVISSGGQQLVDAVPVEKCLSGLTSANRPMPDLVRGEVQLFSRPDFQGESVILAGDCAEVASVLGPAFEGRIGSIRPGPRTGLTVFDAPGMVGKDDVIYLPAGSFRDADVKSVASYRLFQNLVEEDAGISFSSVLGEDYRQVGRGKQKKLVPVKAYRATATFPAGTTKVWLSATEQITVKVGTEFHTVDAVKTAQLEPNAMGQLVFSVEATEMGVPALALRTDRMPADARTLVFLDADLHRKVGAMKDDDIARNRHRLGVRKNVSAEDCASVTAALKQVAGASRSLNAAMRGLVVAGDAPAYSAWALDLSAIGTDRATFFPVADAEAAETFAAATRLDASAAQWDIGGAIKDVGKGIKKGTSEVGRVTVSVVNRPGVLAINPLVGLQGLAEDVGELVGETAKTVVDTVESAVQTVVQVAVEIGGEIVSFVVETIEAIGAFVEFIIEQIGVLVMAFLEWLASLFGWDDIVANAKVIADGIDTGFDEVRKSIGEMNTLVPALQRVASDNLGQTIDFVERSLGTRSRGGSSALEDRDTLEWLLDKVLAVMPDIQLPFPGGSTAQARALDKAVAGLADRLEALVAALGEFGKDILDALAAVASEPQKALPLLGGAVLELIRSMGEQLIELGADLLLALAAVIESAVDTFEAVLTAELNVPGLKELWSVITLGKLDLSASGIFSLLAAIPITATLKLRGKDRLEAIVAQGTTDDVFKWGYAITRWLATIGCGVYAGGQVPRKSRERMHEYVGGSGDTAAGLLCTVFSMNAFTANRQMGTILSTQFIMAGFDMARVVTSYWERNNPVPKENWVFASSFVSLALYLAHAVQVGVILAGEHHEDSRDEALVACEWIFGPLLQDLIGMAACVGDLSVLDLPPGKADSTQLAITAAGYGANAASYLAEGVLHVVG